MSANIGQIKNTEVLIKPSNKLTNYIKDIKKISEDIPTGIQDIIYKNKPKEVPLSKQHKLEYLIDEKDRKFINLLNIQIENKCITKPLETKTSNIATNVKPLTLRDLHWLYKHIQAQNDGTETKVYLHELLEGSEIVLPKNEEIPRNQELEKRCQKLKAEQQNRDYQNMTKNVDSFRKKLPEDTISYQLKMMNSHLIAVFQLIVSVMAGFAFGFTGIEYLVGNLDTGLRLLLGIACAIIIAIAELYFLGKKLNQDLEFENSVKNPKKLDKKVN